MKQPKLKITKKLEDNPVPPPPIPIDVFSNQSLNPIPNSENKMSEQRKSQQTTSADKPITTIDRKTANNKKDDQKTTSNNSQNKKTKITLLPPSATDDPGKQTKTRIKTTKGKRGQEKSIVPRKLIN